MQSSFRQKLRKRRLQLAGIRLVHQVPLHAAGQAILSNWNLGVFRHAQLLGQGPAFDSNAAGGQRFLRDIVKANAAKINRQVVFQTADNDLEYARQILPY